MIVVKGKPYNFRVYWPTVPSGSYPTFKIEVPDGSTFLEGTGVEITGSPGWFLYQTTIPTSAPDSTTNSEWSITWSYLTTARQFYFSVVGPDLVKDETYQRELTKLAIVGSEYNARLIVPESPTDAIAEFYNSSSIVLDGLNVDIEDHRLGTQLSTEIPIAYVIVGEYTLVWQTDLQNYFQRILVASPLYLNYIQKVKFIIDRILKSLDEPQAYTEADIFSGINGGLDVVNSWHPATEYTMGNYPSKLKPFLPVASAWYLLNSQFMLESDLAFSYSGQTVTLDYDRTGQISEQIGRMWDFMTEHLTKAKRSFQGVLAVTRGPATGLRQIRRDRVTRIILPY